MLEIKHVTKVFFPGTVNEKVALEDINLCVNEGDVVSVIGSNGSGKSTLFNMIAGTFPVTGGTITLDGNDITKAPEYRRAFYIGRIFQDPTKGTSGNMSIRDNMTLSLKKGMKGLTFTYNSEKKALFQKLLEPIGLENRLDDNVGLLSGGQRQALTLIMACMSHPRLLLLDEHTAALDPKTAAKVLDATQRIVEKDHLTTMMITHNMRDAIAYGNRLIMMYEGHVIIDVSGEEKKHLTVEQLLNLFSQASGSDEADDKLLLS